MITKRINTMIRVALADVAALITLLYYTMLKAAGWMKKNQYAAELAGYPKGAGELRVLQMSDIHRGPFTGDDFVKSVMDLGNGLKADLVLLTGDYINESPNYIGSVASDIAGLKAEAGWRKIGDRVVYLNRGIGMTSFPFRFNARPEITLFKITGGK